MHTNPASNCDGCRIKLLTCDPRIVQFTYDIQYNFTDCHVAIGYRDQADQALAYNTGKSKLKWPESLHNNMENGKPSSLAVDLFLLDVDGEALFPVSFYEQIYEYYESNKLKFNDPIQWGGAWTTFKDWDHYELVKA